MLLRLYPTRGQKRTLARLFGVDRYVFNESVALSQRREISFYARGKADYSKLRVYLPDWLDDPGIPFQVKKMAMDSAAKALAGARAAFSSSPQASYPAIQASSIA